MATFLKLFCVMGKTPLPTEMEWIKLVKGSWKTQLSLVLAIIRENDPHTLAISWRILENFPFHQCIQLWTYFFPPLLRSRVGKRVSGRKARRKWPDADIAVTGYWSKRPASLTSESFSSVRAKLNHVVPASVHNNKRYKSDPVPLLGICFQLQQEFSNASRSLMS